MFMNLVLFSLETASHECDVKSKGVDIAKGWAARVQFPALQDFFLLHSVQTGSGAHPASYPMGTGGSFP
jgi:hypothetical protein